MYKTTNMDIFEIYLYTKTSGTLGSVQYLSWEWGWSGLLKKRGRESLVKPALSDHHWES